MYNHHTGEWYVVSVTKNDCINETEVGVPPETGVTETLTVYGTRSRLRSLGANATEDTAENTTEDTDTQLHRTASITAPDRIAFMSNQLKA